MIHWYHYVLWSMFCSGAMYEYVWNVFKQIQWKMILPRPLNLICKLKELSLWQWSYWCYIYKKISMNFLCFVYIECAIFILKVKTILSEIIFTSLSFMVFAFVLMIKHEKCFYCLVEWDLFNFNLLSLGTVLFISHQNGVYLYIIEISCWMKWLL